MSALPQASGALSHALSGQDAFVVVLLVLALVAAIALSAAWSTSKERRESALAVLDRLTRWRW